MPLTKINYVYKTTTMKVEKKLPEIMQVRLSGEDRARFHKILEFARQKNKHATDAAIIREIIGLDPPDLLTKTQIDFFFKRVDNLELSKEMKKAANNNLLPQFDETLMQQEKPK